MTSELLRIDDLTITLVRSPRRKRLSLEVGVNGVQARAPKKMRLQDIMLFVQSKRHWIDRHLEEIPTLPAQERFADGVCIEYQGTPTPIRFLTGLRGPIRQSEDGIQIPVIQSSRSIEQSAKTKLIKWLKHQTYQQLERKIAYFAARMGIDRHHSHTVRVRDYKRRWGSCDAHGCLSFNWRLIHAPAAILDYVVVHELAHCVEFNHSKRFWRIVEQEMPKRKEYQLWLKQNGPRLYQL